MWWTVTSPNPYQHSSWTTTCEIPFTASLHAWQRAGYRCFHKHLSPGAGVFLRSMLMPPCRSRQASPSSPTSPTLSRWGCHTAHPTLCSQSCLQRGKHMGSTTVRHYGTSIGLTRYWCQGGSEHSTEHCWTLPVLTGAQP